MGKRVNSNGFLDDLVADGVDGVEASISNLERLLTDQTRGDSANGMCPNSRDVLHQISGVNIDRIWDLFERFAALKSATDPDLVDRMRIREQQGYRPRRRQP